MMHFFRVLQFSRRPAAGLRTGVILLLLAILAAAGFAAGSGESKGPAATTSAEAEMPAGAETPREGTEEGTETAVLAGGCFWGVEAVFEHLAGVLDVVSGYSGGRAETARYEVVGSGETGHAESVRIVFDPQIRALGLRS